VVRHCANFDCEGLARDGVVAEFRDTVDVCLDCGVALVPGERPPPPDSTSELEFLELVTVFIAADLSQGQVVASAMDVAGIPVFVKGELLQGAVGELPPAVGQVEVQVPIERAESAREIAMLWEGPDPDEGPRSERASGGGPLDEFDRVVAETLEDEEERN
jgi:hypothetical protein